MPFLASWPKNVDSVGPRKPCENTVYMNQTAPYLPPALSGNALVHDGDNKESFSGNRKCPRIDPARVCGRLRCTAHAQCSGDLASHFSHFSSDCKGQLTKELLRIYSNRLLNWLGF